MVPMRTPESDDNGSEGAGSLADGFGTVVADDDADDTAFGDGSSDADEASSALQAEGVAEGELVDDGETQVFLDPSDSYTETDLDLNGDGLVDPGDFHTAINDFFDTNVDDDYSSTDSDYAADGHVDHHDVDPIHDVPDDNGLFGLF